MLLAGDEFGRTQGGNNNAYCQDNEISYVHWQLDERQRALLEFTRRCIALRGEQPVLQRRNFFLGSTLDDSQFKDLVWFHPLGREIERSDWDNPELRCFGMFLGGDAIATRGPLGEKVIGDTLLIYCNANSEAVDVRLPAKDWGEAWALLLETARADSRQLGVMPGDTFSLPAQSVAVFRQHLTSA
jgi:glycogen operon protein